MKKKMFVIFAILAVCFGAAISVHAKMNDLNKSFHGDYVNKVITNF